MTAFNLSHLLKTLSPDGVTLGIRASRCDVGAWGQNQFIAVPDTAVMKCRGWSM